MKNRIHAFSITVAGLMFYRTVHASPFKGEALDEVAEVVSWLVLILAPIIVVGLFWLVHIMPEKVAEKRQHPQAQAIQTLCLLSLAFGGLLWPLAFVWAYSKPVFYKMAYGADTLEHEPPAQEKQQADGARSKPAAAGELESLRAQVAALEAQLAQRSSQH